MQFPPRNQTYPKVAIQPLQMALFPCRGGRTHRTPALLKAESCSSHCARKSSVYLDTHSFASRCPPQNKYMALADQNQIEASGTFQNRTRKHMGMTLSAQPKAGHVEVLPGDLRRSSRMRLRVSFRACSPQTAAWGKAHELPACEHLASHKSCHDPRQRHEQKIGWPSQNHVDG